jgi:hypothetical protein
MEQLKRWADNLHTVSACLPFCQRILRSRQGRTEGFHNHVGTLNMYIKIHTYYNTKVTSTHVQLIINKYSMLEKKKILRILKFSSQYFVL